MNKPLITVITISRTGSNYFCDLVEKSFTNIHVSYELFNKNECYIGDFKLYNKFKDNYDNVPLKELYTKIKDNPLQLLKNISQHCKEESFLFKLFYDHLSLEQTKEIITNSSCIIFLKRDFLDRFVSNEKARNLNEYSCIDTTHKKIFFDKKEYQRKRVYYDTLETKIYDIVKECSIPSIDIHYETFHSLDTHLQRLFLQQNVFDKYVSEVGITIRENPSPPRFFKQDLTSCYEEKIENYPEFEEYFKNIRNNNPV